MKYSGIVQKGSKTAKELGFPTANIGLDDPEPSGVYAALVKVGEEEYESVAFADQARHLLEAHLLDFDADIYGWNITIGLLKKIRDRLHFSDNTAMREAIASDITKARAYFADLR